MTSAAHAYVEQALADVEDAHGSTPNKIKIILTDVEKSIYL